MKTTISATKRELVRLVGITGAGLVTAVAAPAIIAAPARAEARRRI